MAIVRERRQFSVGPIGVARASSGGQQIGRSIAGFAGTVGDIMYREAAKTAQKTGTEAGLGAERSEIITIDPATGKPQAYAVPEGFGSIAADAYQTVVLDRFQSSIDEEIRAKAKELAAKYEDPKTFSAMLGDYVDAMAANSEGMFEEYITSTGESYRLSTEANLLGAKIAKERAAAAQSILTSNNQASEQIFDLAAAGDYEAAIAMVESRTGMTANGIAAGLLKGGSDQATKDGLSVDAAAGILQNVLKDASGVQSASIATYMMSQGLEGGGNLSADQKAALDLIRPYITRDNTAAILGEFNRIQGGYAAIRAAQVAERQTEIDQALRDAKKAATELLLGQIDADTSAQNIAFDSMGKALQSDVVGIVGANIEALDTQFGLYEAENAILARTGGLTATQALDLNRDRRQAIAAGILTTIGANVTDKQKDKIAQYLFTGVDSDLNGVPSNAAEGIYRYRNSGLYQSEDQDFAADLMSKSVDELQLQSDLNIKQFQFTQEVIRLQGMVRDNTVTTEDFKDFGALTGQYLRDGVIDDGVASNAYRGIDLAKGKFIASRAGADASSLELTKLSAYIASGGEQDLKLSQYLREAGDQIIRSVNEEDLPAASNHVNGMAEDRRKIETAAQQAADEQMVVSLVASGLGDVRNSDHREAADKLFAEFGVDLFSPESLNSDVHGVLRGAGSQVLFDGLERLALGLAMPEDQAAVALAHFVNLHKDKEAVDIADPSGNQLPYSAYINRIGDALPRSTQLFLEEVHMIHTLTGEPVTKIAQDLRSRRESVNHSAVMNQVFGGKTASAWVRENGKSWFGQTPQSFAPELESVAEYYAISGYDAGAIKGRIKSYLDLNYAKSKDEDYMLDPIFLNEGYSRFSMEKMYPDTAERTEMLRIITSELPAEYTLHNLTVASSKKSVWLVGDERFGSNVLFAYTKDERTNELIPLFVTDEKGDQVFASWGDDELIEYREQRAHEEDAERKRKIEELAKAREAAREGPLGEMLYGLDTDFSLVPAH